MCVHMHVILLQDIILVIVIIAFGIVVVNSFLGLFFGFNQEMFRAWFPRDPSHDGDEEAGCQEGKCHL